MAVAEALLNMAGAVITGLADIKCSANWMLAVKQPGEGAWLYDAACALRDLLMELGVAIDGGKDSLSMASQGSAPDGTSELVKAPPELVMAPYALMPDVQLRVTSDLKRIGSRLLLLPVGSKHRLGGSAFAQVLGQLGDEAPDIEEAAALRAVFEAVQDLVKARAILSCHDVSDGGLIVTLLEMAFAGDKGWRVALEGEGAGGDELYAALFAEEAGVVVEVADEAKAQAILESHGVAGVDLGEVTEADVELRFGAEVVLKESVRALHAVWEETSYQLERLQQNPECAEQEWLSHRAPAGTSPYRLTFDPDAPVGRRGGSRLQAEGRRAARRGHQRRPGVGRGFQGRRLRGLGRHHDRPDGGGHRPGRLPDAHVPGRVRVRRRARFGQGLGVGDTATTSGCRSSSRPSSPGRTPSRWACATAAS